MSEKSVQEIAMLLDQVKDMLAQVASQVYQAQADDGRIDWQEGLALGASGMASAMALVNAFKQLSQESVGELITVLRDSDIKIG